MQVPATLRALAPLAVVSIASTFATVPALGADATDCDPKDTECQAQRERAEEESRRQTATEGAVGILQGGGRIVPCVGQLGGPGVCGISATPPVIVSGPLRLRRVDASVGVSHALSRNWSIGALLAAGRSRASRTETELSENPAATADTDRATTVRQNQASLAGILTWFDTSGLSVETSLSVQRSSFDFERTDTTPGLSTRTFIADGNGRAVGASVVLSRAWRAAPTTWIPFAGIDYVDSRVDPFRATIPNPPPGTLEAIDVSQQRAKATFVRAGLQLQWPVSRSFGVFVPYLRGVWRQRVALDSDPIVADVEGKPPLISELDSELGRRSATAALGTLGLFSGGWSMFVDLAAHRASGKVRETRVAVGLQFER